MTKRLAIAFFLLFLFVPCATRAQGPSLGAEIARQIASTLPWERSNVEVSGVSIPGLEKVGEYDDARVRVPAGMAKTGKVSFPVSFFRKGVEFKSLWATAQIKVFKLAVVALRPIKSRRKVARADVRLARVDVRDTQDSFSSVDEVAGKVARRPIRAGHVVKKDYVRPEVVVKRGDRVVVSMRGGNIRIKSSAVAVENGFQGRPMRVRTSSGKEISGLVVGPGEIAVGF
ncbi:MAG: flagellar basal body P-ring formation chaperone FlgA [Thermodesulfobacteriota bacterium]